MARVMALRIFVDKCSNLPKMDKSGACDSYVKIKFRDRKQSTDVIYANANPLFSSELIFQLDESPLSLEETLSISVMDWERFGKNRLIGSATASLKKVFQTSADSFHLQLTLSPSVQSTNSPFVDFTVKYEGGPKPEDEQEAEGEADQAVEEGIEESGGADGGGDPRPSQPANSKPAKRKLKGVTLDDSPRNFQIRVKILCARRLQGENINTLCSVSLDREKKYTRVQKGTTSPTWNEMFYFNLKISSRELVDKIIDFNVYESKKIRSDPLIGTFKCGLGYVYECPSRAVINKWLFLHLPNQELTTSTGFLKVCIAIVGANETPPKFEDDNENYDVESNLLKPVGATVQPMMMVVNIYEAEDLPQMDSSTISVIKSFFGKKEKKDQVDPYVVTSFSGKALKSSIIPNSDHPQFMESFAIGFMFPTLCENVKFTLMDWDRMNQNDQIGVANLLITAISASGENGFMPVFGPAYLNVYGSHREMSMFSNEYQQAKEGKVEGFGYRGRLLLELKTIPNKPSLPPIDLIDRDVRLRIDKYRKRRMFVLYGLIQNAGMLQELDGMIMFELSIGLYGNIFDAKSEPTSSATQPLTPVFDGNHYYFIPFETSKPAMRIECQWEDVIFRMENMNQLLHGQSKIEKYIAFIKGMIAREADYKEIACVAIKAVEDIINDLKQPLSSVEHFSNATVLDRNLHEMRVATLNHIVENLGLLYKTARQVDKLLEELNSIRGSIQQLINDPQMSVPDIIVWMICNQERVGYARVNPCDVYYSRNATRAGRKCWKRMTLDLKEPPKNQTVKKQSVAKLQMMFWLGLKQNEKQWKESIDKDMQLCIQAETYENQCAIVGTSKWGTVALSRPNFSDVTGKLNLPKEEFKCPEGWSWEGDWFVSVDSGSSDAIRQKTVTEEIFESESRIPGMKWEKSASPYTTAFGDPADANAPLEKNWEWMDDWTVDLKRAVDEYGWEYSALDGQLTGYSPVEKLYHTTRRRRMLRKRCFKPGPQLELAKTVMSAPQQDGWEYSTFFNTKFHRTNRKMDMVRRRRWLRKMVCGKDAVPCMFSFGNSDKSASIIAPTMSFQVKTVHKFQLRAYIYQGRDLTAKDSDGLSDPYLYVICNNHSQRTRTVKKTVSPIWDESLVFVEIIFHETLESLKENLVDIVLEGFDEDAIGTDEFIGQSLPVRPTVRSISNPTPCRLQWVPLHCRGKQCGEVLAAFELINLQGMNYPLPPLKNKTVYSIPADVRPVLEKCTLKIMAWGLRDMKSYQLLSVKSPSCAIEIGDEVAETARIAKLKQRINFPEPFMTIETNIPKNPAYCPPINIKIFDHREFGWNPMVALCSVSDLEKYRRNPIEQAKSFLDYLNPIKKNTLTSVSSPAKRSEDFFEGDSEQNLVVRAKESITSCTNLATAKKLNGEVDWWSKFYASTGDHEKCGKYIQKGFDTIKIHEKPLEDVPEFNRFHDFCETFDLCIGKAKEDRNEIVGQFKGSFQIIPADVSSKQAEMAVPQIRGDDCVIRVYVIRGEDLQPMDSSGLCDPYLKIQLGSTTIDTKKDYIPNTLNPLFARMFELKAKIPEERNLVISVMDYDVHSGNDFIGSTVIDLEDRLLSKHRATCGLPQNYYTDGPNIWRDSRRPKQILEEVCLRNNLAQPVYFDRCLKIGDRSFFLEDFEIFANGNAYLGEESERLALHILNRMPLVKEHVETRPLYNDIQPDLEQGKLMLWVDMFPLSLGPPGPQIDISPRKPRRYELRVIIWNTADVPLMETSLIGGEQMSDIFLKGWISGVDTVQKTDVHYRSMDGEGNFNWRFVFKFDYFDAEEEMVVTRKEHFWSLNETERRLKPHLSLQIWDNDTFSAIDFIGMADLSLQNLPTPAPTKKACTLSCYDATAETQSLFEVRRLRGFWPCYNIKEGKSVMAGKVEMEFELLSEQEATEKPAGLGRSEPNSNPHLSAPKRPDTSFKWFTSPYKAFRYILWRRYKWQMITALVILLIVGFIALIIYAIPGATIDKIVSKYF